MTPDARRRPSTLFRAVVGTVAVLFFVLFVALGTWQLKRRVWKLDLIARVEQRVHAFAVAPPGPAQWPQVTAVSDEYRHVVLSGKFLNQSQTLVQAVTDLGSGYWVITPLQTAGGGIVLVNRGFVAADDRGRVEPGGGETRKSGEAQAAEEAQTAGEPLMAGEATVTGLLRMTEPRGGFLRHNDPAVNRWFSRDVQAIAQARGLSNVAPYFVDADAGPAARADGEPAERPPGNRPQGASLAAASSAATVTPIGGLTVLHFRNTHLVYAITWYTLALMVAGAIWLGIRSDGHT